MSRVHTPQCTPRIALCCALLVNCSALLLGVTQVLGTDSFARGDVTVVVTRRWVVQFLLGSLEFGSVDTWGLGPEAADGSHEKVLADAFLYTLMGSREDGSVVTW